MRTVDRVIIVSALLGLAMVLLLAPDNAKAQGGGFPSDEPRHALPKEFGFIAQGHDQPWDAPQPGERGFRHAPNHDWYRPLRQLPTAPYPGASCCNGDTPTMPGDCRSTRARTLPDGSWAALLDGLWVPIPPGVVHPETDNKEWAAAHICALNGVIMCFIPKRTGG